MDGPSKRRLILALSAGALYAGVGGYLVFTGLMSSYSILMIGLAIGGLIRLVRPRP